MAKSKLPDVVQVENHAISLQLNSAPLDLLASILAVGIITREKAGAQSVAERAVDYAVAIRAEVAKRGL